MSALRNYLNKIKPNFQKGGKLHAFESVFDGFESFLYVPNTTAKSGASIHDSIDSKRIMSFVVIALIPALLFGMYNVGYQNFKAAGTLDAASFIEVFGFGFLAVLPKLLVSYIVGLGIEFARMFLFFSYPLAMSGDKVWVAKDAIFGLGNTLPDGFTAATPLGQLAQGSMPSASLCDSIIGFIPGCIGETSVIAIAIGAIILLWTGIASWKTMGSVFAGGIVMALIFQALGMTPIAWYEHIVLGGFCFGAVFMATDPVTSARTEKGKYFYGFFIGAIAVIVRVMNPGYPEGMMLAIFNNTIYGVYFNHEGETAGLGAEIKDNLKWQQKFQGKKIHKDGVEGIALGVEKDAPASDPNNVDAVTGATLTSNGVDAMLKEGLAKFIK